jgi:hypothetical protein
VAWYYEKSGIFSVRSAYHLAVQLDRANQNMEGCSSWPKGNRPIYNDIWKATVPPKVRVFAWRLSQDSLATQTNRKTQTLEKDAICQLCGMEEESSYHAVVRCMKAVALQHEICKHWSLSGELQFRYSGPDWLPQLLSLEDKETRGQILLLLWRVWHLRNEVTHGQGKGGITSSSEFLKHYAIPLGFAGKLRVRAADDKGKGKLEEGGVVKGHDWDEVSGSTRRSKGWEPLPEGWAKPNTDAGYYPNTGDASSGIVIRDRNGRVLLSAWRTWEHMASAEEAEVVT